MDLFSLKTKLYLGEDALDHLYSLPPGPVVVVTDPYLVRSGAVAAVTNRLEERHTDYSIFSELGPDPDLDTVAAGTRLLLQRTPAAVVALGGGAAIDTAKAMVCASSQRRGTGTDKAPYFVAIPTTSGTGSEVTSYTVLRDAEQGVKYPLSHPDLIPDAALLDPGFTRTLPPNVAASTGMDVLTHGLEALVSPSANDFTDLFSLEAVRLCFTWLPVFFRNPGHLEARQKMLHASAMAGAAFTNAGLGLCHGMAHSLGAIFHLPHGTANAIALPYVIAYNAGLGKYRSHDAPKSYARAAQALGLPGAGPLSLCRQLVRAVRGLCRELGLPLSLSAYGVESCAFLSATEALLDNILADPCTAGNPIPISRDILRQLLNEVYSGHWEV